MKRAALRAGALVRLGRLFGERVQPAVDVGVVVLVVVHERLDHLARLLGRRGVVEVHQRLAMHLALQDREVAADRGNVERSVMPLPPSFSSPRIRSAINVYL